MCNVANRRTFRVGANGDESAWNRPPPPPLVSTETGSETMATNA
jgi:hypothetical protein